MTEQVTMSTVDGGTVRFVLSHDPEFGAKPAKVEKLGGGGFTVGELIAALSFMPSDTLVTRYCDELVIGVERRITGRSEADYEHGQFNDQLPAYNTKHVALW